jgi:hypothetical protein
MNNMEAFVARLTALVQRSKDINLLALASSDAHLVHHWNWFIANCEVRVFPSTLPQLPFSLHRSPCLPFLIPLLPHLPPRLLPILTTLFIFQHKAQDPTAWDELTIWFDYFQNMFEYIPPVEPTLNPSWTQAPYVPLPGPNPLVVLQNITVSPAVVDHSPSPHSLGLVGNISNSPPHADAPLLGSTSVPHVLPNPSPAINLAPHSTFRDPLVISLSTAPLTAPTLNNFPVINKAAMWPSLPPATLSTAPLPTDPNISTLKLFYFKTLSTAPLQLPPPPSTSAIIPTNPSLTSVPDPQISDAIALSLAPDSAIPYFDNPFNQSDPSPMAQAISALAHKANALLDIEAQTGHHTPSVNNPELAFCL